MFCLLATESGAQASNLATIISGVINAVAVIIVYLLTKNFQKKQDEKSQEFQEMQAKEAKDFQKKQDEESQNFQEKLSEESKKYQKIQAKESRDFQEKLAEESRRLEEKINQKNLEHDYKSNQPYFKMEKLDIYIDSKRIYGQDLLFTNWFYPDDKRREITDYENKIELQTILRFKNIGKGLAKNVKLSGLYLNREKALEDANKNHYSNHQIPHFFVRDNNNGNKEKHYTFLYPNYELQGKNGKLSYPKSNAVNFFLSYINYTEYNFRIVNNKEYIEVPINLSDLSILNYYLIYTNLTTKIPSLKVQLDYEDLYGHKYNDEIDLQFKKISTKESPNVNKKEDKITVVAELKEADNSKLRTKRIK